MTGPGSATAKPSPRPCRAQAETVTVTVTVALPPPPPPHPASPSTDSFLPRAATFPRKINGTCVPRQVPNEIINRESPRPLPAHGQPPVSCRRSPHRRLSPASPAPAQPPPRSEGLAGVPFHLQEREEPPLLRVGARGRRPRPGRVLHVLLRHGRPWQRDALLRTRHHRATRSGLVPHTGARPAPRSPRGERGNVIERRRLPGRRRRGCRGNGGAEGQRCPAGHPAQRGRRASPAPPGELLPRHRPPTGR